MKLQTRSCIRFITRKWAPAMGGMETYSLRLTEELSKTHQLNIIALPGKPNGDVPPPGALISFGLKTAARLLFASPVKVVHLGDMAIWPLGWVASLRHPSSCIILSAHGSDLNYAKNATFTGRLYAAYIKIGAKLLRHSHVIANSDWIADLAREFGFQHVTKVPLATDIQSADASGTYNTGNHRPKNYSAKTHSDYLFFAGRIIPSKGLSFIVKDVLSSMVNPPKIRVAGTIWDKEEAEILESPLVEYLGNLAADQLAIEYRQAMAVVVPSLSKEGFGLVAAEAAACGAIVIASNHSGLAEVVTADIGFLADNGSAPDWVSAIENVRGWSNQERSSFAIDSQSIACSRYSWDRVARDTAAIYDSAKKNVSTLK